MKRVSQMLVLTGIAATLCLSVPQATAQGRPGRGNFDPAEMQQRMMERYKEALEVKSDAEWKIIEGRIQKVSDARREVGFGGGRGMFGGPGRRPGGDQGGDQAQNRPRNPFGGEPSPDAEALQKAIDAKAPADEIKAKLAKYRDSRKQKEAALETARQDLKKVLSVRQEAIAVMLGLLD